MPELMGKLDTSVNGPEGLPPFDGDAWDRVDWRFHEEQVRRLRGRIFKAVQDGDWPLARNVQKLMLRSWSSTLVSVRQVTQRNAGRRTAGIDGRVALTSQARAEVAVLVHATIGSHRPSPVRRVYIPKASDKTKMRPLGIPVLSDRCHQARVRKCAGARVGGPVRAKILWVPAGSRLSRRDRILVQYPVREIQAGVDS
jgi:RNA-directed DNA polymerase